MSHPSLPKVGLADLPVEVAVIIALIELNQPDYDQDGEVFSNREGRLPEQPRGYYREYTVTTPGYADRGRRRIVTGQQGELFYSEDHSNSFVEVVLDP